MPTLLESADTERIQFGPMMIPGLGTIQPRTLTIASVHFEPRQRPDLHHSRHIPMFLPAAPKGKYVTCTVCDSQQMIRNTSDPNEATPTGLPMPVPVDVIAQSLLDSWCHAGVDLKNNARPRPGIILLKGDTPDEEEMRRMLKMEEILCRAGVEEADQIEKTGEGRILQYHRDCLSWLGSERREWFKPIERGLTKKSPASGNMINMNATVDDKGTDLIEYYVKYALKPEEYGDEHIAAMFKNNPTLRESTAIRLGIRRESKDAK